MKKRRAAGLVLWLLLAASSAAAQDRVLLAPADGGTGVAGLGHALRIQLAGIAEVSVRSEPIQGAGLQQRVRHAGELAEREDALLVAWVDPPLEQPDGSREVVIYAVGRREGRAVLEVVRVPGDAGPAVDRTLALKLREIVDALLATREAGQDPLLLPPPPPPGPQWVPLGRVGLAVTAIEGTGVGQWGGFGDMALELQLEHARVAAAVGMLLSPSVQIARGGQRVRISELTPELDLAASLRAGPLWLGASAGLALAVVQAEGLHGDGQRGDRSFALFSSRALLRVEASLSERLSLGLAIGVDVRFDRRRLEVGGEPVADLGRVRPTGRLALVIR